MTKFVLCFQYKVLSNACHIILSTTITYDNIFLISFLQLGKLNLRGRMSSHELMSRARSRPSEDGLLSVEVPTNSPGSVLIPPDSGGSEIL